MTPYKCHLITARSTPDIGKNKKNLDTPCRVIVFARNRPDTPAPAGAAAVAAIGCGGNRRLHRKLARFDAAVRTGCP